VEKDLAEVLGKCSICLGNMAFSLQSWKKDEKDLGPMWNEFTQCLKAINTKDEHGANLNNPCSAIAAILSTMGAFLRFRPALVKCVNEHDLDLILSFILMEAPTPANRGDENAAARISDVQKDGIGILGILCSEAHPDPINEKICAVFLTVLMRHNSATTAVMSEVLNAMMDMYSADEDEPNNHEQVFRKKDVLGAFQKSVPILKRKIREDEKMSDVDDAEVEFWKETALNATRFIRYKKGN